MKIRFHLTNSPLPAIADVSANAIVEITNGILYNQAESVTLTVNGEERSIPVKDINKIEICLK